MSRLPRPLEPIWPLAKRAHLAATVIVGALARVLSPLFGQRGLPRHASLSSAATAAAEPTTTTVHVGPPGEVIDRPSAVGEPPLHHVFEKARIGHLPDQHVLDLQDGTVVGNYGAIITTNGTFDFETSRYFSVYKWFEHPLFLRARLPRPHRVDGTVVSLATRGGDHNYYHFLLEVLPRWAMVRRILPDVDIDAVFAPFALGYQRDFLALAGIEADRIIPTGTVPSVRASRLLVPGYPNMRELQPRWMVDWVRQTFKPVDTDAKPRRLFVTRGSGPNTRRLIQASAVEAMLHERGFVSIDPGTMSVQEQIDHFAAAEEVVGIHGAALTNLVFAPPGVRVLELFAPAYVNPCYWAVLQSVPGARYRYLLGRGEPARPDRPMYTIQADVDLGPEQVAQALDVLLER